MGLAVAPSTLIHSFLTVGTILHPSCIWTYGLQMAGHAGVSGSVRLTPPKRVEPGAEQKHCNEQTYNRLRGAPSRACAAVIPRAETSANVGVRGNAATNKPITLVQQDPGKEKNCNKVADRREISMDYAAIPACYEPPGFEPTPKEL